MMRFAHPHMETVIDIDPQHIPCLVVENAGFFRQLVQDIYNQINGNGGDTVLSDDYRPVDFSKYADIIDSFASFTVNRKTLQSKIISALERTAVNEVFYLKTSELLQAVEQYFNELTMDSSAELYCAKLNISAIIKAVGISVAEEYAEPLEQYLDYMELMREYDRERVFVFINMRSYFSDEEMLRFMDTTSSQGYKIMLIDSKLCSLLPFEKRLIIDEDLCEILI